MTSEPASSPFDDVAGAYDATFTHTAIGATLRAAVWRRLDARWSAGATVLELSCGTGEDAVHLARRGVRVLATDASAGMVAIARRKVEDAGVGSLVEVRQLPIERLADVDEIGWLDEIDWLDESDLLCFDGVLSNFGGINCIEDLGRTGRAMARLVRPGGHAMLCVMGPLVPWEWLFHLARADAARAFRRFRSSPAPWRGMSVRYPSARRLARAFAPVFITIRTAAVGCLVPPSYMEPWAGRHPRLLRLLARTEQLVETWPPVAALADHYLIELERTREPA